MKLHSPGQANTLVFYFILYLIGFQMIFGGILIFLDAPFWLTTGSVQFFGLLVPFLFYLLITKQKLKQVMPWNKLSVKSLILVSVFTLALNPLIQVIAYLTAFISMPVIDVSDITGSPMWLMFIIVAIFPSFFEEFWFRGVMYQGYRAGGISVLKTALITGVFFGFFHMNLHQAIYATIIGIFFTFLVYYTKSIWAAILAHLINNGLAVITAYITPYQEWLANNENTFFIIMAIATVVLLPLGTICLLQLKKMHQATYSERGEGTEIEEMVEEKENRKILTWGFWATTALLGVMTLLNEVVMRLEIE